MPTIIVFSDEMNCRVLSFKATATTIPSSIGALSHLESFYLGEYRYPPVSVTAQVPIGFKNLSKLKTLYYARCCWASHNFSDFGILAFLYRSISWFGYIGPPPMFPSDSFSKMNFLESLYSELDTPGVWISSLWYVIIGKFNSRMELGRFRTCHLWRSWSQCTPVIPWRTEHRWGAKQHLYGIFNRTISQNTGSMVFPSSLLQLATPTSMYWIYLLKHLSGVIQDSFVESIYFLWCRNVFDNTGMTGTLPSSVNLPELADLCACQFTFPLFSASNCKRLLKYY